MNDLEFFKRVAVILNWATGEDGFERRYPTSPFDTGHAICKECKSPAWDEHNVDCELGNVLEILHDKIEELEALA